jgi:hypothetical protein
MTMDDIINSTMDYKPSPRHKRKSFDKNKARKRRSISLPEYLDMNSIIDESTTGEIDNVIKKDKNDNHTDESDKISHQNKTQWGSHNKILRYIPAIHIQKNNFTQMQTQPDIHTQRKSPTSISSDSPKRFSRSLDTNGSKILSESCDATENPIKRSPSSLDSYYNKDSSKKIKKSSDSGCDSPKKTKSSDSCDSPTKISKSLNDDHHDDHNLLKKQKLIETDSIGKIYRESDDSLRSQKNVEYDSQKKSPKLYRVFSRKSLKKPRDSISIVTFSDDHICHDDKQINPIYDRIESDMELKRTSSSTIESIGKNRFLSQMSAYENGDNTILYHSDNTKKFGAFRVISIDQNCFNCKGKNSYPLLTFDLVQSKYTSLDIIINSDGKAEIMENTDGMLNYFMVFSKKWEMEFINDYHPITVFCRNHVTYTIDEFIKIYSILLIKIQAHVYNSSSGSTDNWW